MVIFVNTSIKSNSMGALLFGMLHFRIFIRYDFFPVFTKKTSKKHKTVNHFNTQNLFNTRIFQGSE